MLIADSVPNGFWYNIHSNVSIAERFVRVMTTHVGYSQYQPLYAKAVIEKGFSSTSWCKLVTDLNGLSQVRRGRFQNWTLDFFSVVRMPLQRNMGYKTESQIYAWSVIRPMPGLWCSELSAFAVDARLTSYKHQESRRDWALARVPHLFTRLRPCINNSWPVSAQALYRHLSLEFFFRWSKHKLCCSIQA